MYLVHLLRKVAVTSSTHWLYSILMLLIIVLDICFSPLKSEWFGVFGLNCIFM